MRPSEEKHNARVACDKSQFDTPGVDQISILAANANCWDSAGNFLALISLHWLLFRYVVYMHQSLWLSYLLAALCNIKQQCVSAGELTCCFL